MHPKLFCLIAAPLVLALAAPAQAPAQNKLEFMNWYIDSREDLFPNYLTASGNVAGDGLFKVIPAEVLERDGDNKVSGYKIGFSVDDAYAGTYPAMFTVPGMQLFRTKVQTIGGKSYETLDPARPLTKFNPSTVFLSADNSWVMEVSLGATVSIPALDGGQRSGIAMLVLAPAGQKRPMSGAGTVLQASYQERHIPPARESYSGSFDAVTQAIRMYGTPGQPSATGELYAALRFDNPTLQLYGSSAGGVANDPGLYETHLGPGAYATDLGTASAPGFLGIFVQAAQYEAQAHLVFPFLVAQSPGGPNTSLDVFGVKMRLDPGSLAGASAFIDAGYAGPVKRYAAKGSAGWDEDQRGVFNSGRIAVPNSPAFIGANLWLQALLATVSLQPVASTNVVRLTLR